MKVGDLVMQQSVADSFAPGDRDWTGIIVERSMSGLWMVLIDCVIYQMLERDLEVVCEAG